MKKEAKTSVWLSRAGGYGTVLDVTSGVDMRSAHQFADKAEAEQMADVMNGKMSGELAGA